MYSWSLPNCASLVLKSHILEYSYHPVEMVLDPDLYTFMVFFIVFFYILPSFCVRTRLHRSSQTNPYLCSMQPALHLSLSCFDMTSTKPQPGYLYPAYLEDLAEHWLTANMRVGPQPQQEISAVLQVRSTPLQAMCQPASRPTSLRLTGLSPSGVLSTPGSLWWSYTSPHMHSEGEEASEQQPHTVITDVYLLMAV